MIALHVEVEAILQKKQLALIVKEKEKLLIQFHSLNHREDNFSFVADARHPPRCMN